MNDNTAPRAIIPTAWKIYESGDVDGNRVRACGPVVQETRPANEYGPGYVVTRPALGGLMIHEDRGDWGTCLLDPWKDGHRHGLTRGTEDGVTEYLGSFNTWKAAQFAGAAVVAGFDLSDPIDLAEVRRQYRASERAKRSAKLNKKFAGLRFA